MSTVVKTIQFTGEDIELDVTPVPWPNKKMTLKRCIAIAAWWITCIILPLVAIPLGMLFGAVKGAGSGAYDALSATYSDLHRWWRMFEES
jgi:hypothetical protein